MHPRFLSGLFAIIVTTLSFTMTPSISRADYPTTSAPVEKLAVEQYLNQGIELERGLRWGEALSHYEKAHRAYPQDEKILTRIEEVRVHYGIARRYNDTSYQNWLNNMGEAEVLNLVDEVLFKAQSHYVHQIDWQNVIKDGAESIEIALTNNNFQNYHLKNVSAEWVDNFRFDLNRRVKNAVIRNRQEAVEAIRVASKLGRQHLGLSPAVVALEFTYNTAITLDDYSTFLTTNQLNELYSQIDGNFVGLGIELQGRDGALRIVKVIERSPADEGGLRAGDQIISVNGIDTSKATTDQAASLLQGPEGSLVDLTIRTIDGGTKALKLKRRPIEVPSIESAQIIDQQNGIAYFHLTSFQKTTVRELDNTLWDLLCETN